MTRPFGTKTVSRWALLIVLTGVDQTATRADGKMTPPTPAEIQAKATKDFVAFNSRQVAIVRGADGTPRFFDHTGKDLGEPIFFLDQTGYSESWPLCKGQQLTHGESV